MDAKKCDDLKTKLYSQPEPQIVPIDEFFDGNDDEASLGCNLIEHPGIDVFRRILLGLLDRADVVAVYAQISVKNVGRLQIGCLSSAQSHSMNLLMLLRRYSQTMWVRPNMKFQSR